MQRVKVSLLAQLLFLLRKYGGYCKGFGFQNIRLSCTPMLQNTLPTSLSQISITYRPITFNRTILKSLCKLMMFWCIR